MEGDHHKKTVLRSGVYPSSSKLALEYVQSVDVSCSFAGLERVRISFVSTGDHQTPVKDILRPRKLLETESFREPTQSFR